MILLGLPAAFLPGAAEAGDAVFSKDQIELSLLTGVGRGVIASSGRGPGLSETLLRYGRYSAPLDLGLLSGNAGWLVEGIAVVDAANPSTFGGGIAFVPRYVFKGHPLRPMVTVGLGALWTNEKIPSGTSDFNFRSHAGLGLKFIWDEGWGLDVEARFVHVSNNNFAQPNPGINSVEVLLGFYLTP